MTLRSSTLAALLLCLALAACGGDSGDNPGTGTPGTPGGTPGAGGNEPGQPPAVTPQLRCAP